MTGGISTWTVRFPGDHRDRVFEAEDLALRAAVAQAWSTAPSFVTYPDGNRYAVFAMHETCVISTVDNHGSRRTFGGGQGTGRSIGGS